jgi:hypothetical protein
MMYLQFYNGTEGPQKGRFSRWNFVAPAMQPEIKVLPVWLTPSLICSWRLHPGAVPPSTNEMLDLINMEWPTFQIFVLGGTESEKACG